MVRRGIAKKYDMLGFEGLLIAVGEADILADGNPRDKGERVSLMEPLILSSESRYRSELSDLALELSAASSGFRRSLPAAVMSALSNLVRSMNCYYSNLIEGHNTHPIEIERAMNGEYSTDLHKRNLQLEARAHIEVQRWIDGGALRGRSLEVASILEIHRKFCESLPEALLTVQGAANEKAIKICPGKVRLHDVQVGHHIAISPGAIERFLNRFEQVFSKLGKSDALLNAGAAHHRILWIHPFLDGNGRVARLMSHAQLLDLLDTGSVWSVARGLARNVDQYKLLLMKADQQRANDFDGRGNLSEMALADFLRFFLKTCLDQVQFMESLVQPDRLRERIVAWCDEEAKLGEIPVRSAILLEAILYRGELPRADVADLLGASPRHARRSISALLAAGVLTSESDRSPLRIAFPVKVAERWLPGLFPQ